MVNDLAKRAFISYEASEMPVSDHRMISATFQWERCVGLATVFRMPRDSMHLGIKGEFFEEAKVPVASRAAFDDALQHDIIDKAWTELVSAMDQVAANTAALHGDGPIPKKFLGKEVCKFVKIRNSAPVIKKGRDDAFQSQVDDCGIQLRQRITQIRRFDAVIAQQRATDPMTDSRHAAICSTWHAILKSRGFAPSFPVWFTREVDAPCPLGPPSLGITKWMREILVERVQKWRSLYNNTRIKNVRRIFEEDWSGGGKLFHRALRAPQSPHVDAIDRTTVLRVRLMRSRHKSVSVFTVLHDDLQLVSVGQHWSQGPAEGVVSFLKEGRIYLKITKGSFKTGDIVAATTCHVPEHALRLAADFWMSYWQNPQQVDCTDSRVTQVVDSLPELPQIGNEITATELKNALKTLSVTKARGMDAVTNWELKHMCSELQSMLLKFLNRVNATGQWPQSLIKARMHLIRKNSEPGDINSTRPICILPNVYRLWGKIMTAKCFRHLQGKIPASICGSVPGRSSIDLAMQLQSQIEEHLISGIPLYGASLDLSKAFNTLSRPLLAKMCARLGLGKIWEPYSSFLKNLRRYFTLKQQWSDAILSDTGVPEGCPLSVVMMLVVTWAITGSIANRCPNKIMSSYVDDWTLRDTDPQGLVGQLEYVRDITSLLGMTLSMQKTIPYATTPTARKTLARHLRNHNLPSEVYDNGHCLGTQFQARAAKVTDLREQRVTDNVPKLKKLKVMPWSRSKKASLLLTGIFPAMFYGCEFHDMGLHFISHQRSLCNAAVWRDKPYLSHFLTPILSLKPVYEPWLWILQRVFLSFRRLLWLRPEDTLRLWNLAVGRPSNKHTVGPITILMAHLRRLGWVLKPEMECQAQNGRFFNLQTISMSQYKILTQDSWQEWLIPKLRVKLSMPDLTGFDITTSCWNTKDPQQEGFMATMRSGGLFTNRVKSRISCVVSPNCVLCGQPDGMSHRIYHCSATQRIREDLGLQHLEHVLDPASCGVYLKNLRQQNYMQRL